MATKVFMEALSPTMEEGRIVKWVKGEGDTVANGDILAEVETDKAVMEIVARGDGVLRARLIAEGGTAPVGQMIGVIAAADENIDELTAGAGGGGAASAAPKDAGGPPQKQDTAAAPSADHQTTAPVTKKAQEAAPP